MHFLNITAFTLAIFTIQHSSAIPPGDEETQPSQQSLAVPSRGPSAVDVTEQVVRLYLTDTPQTQPLAPPGTALRRRGAGIARDGESPLEFMLRVDVV